ncbi:MAG: alpha/beta hydrolase [Opitutia bacterium AMD-G3]|nr:MAG: alpha/beta hydrolase [Opitutae bacterium AMD-G3]
MSLPRLAPLFFAVAAYAADALPPKQPLWEGVAPGLKAGEAPLPTKASYTVHLPAKPNGAAIVICPGGGYGGLVVGGEGHGIAKWLNAHGIAGIVLEYRLPAGRAQVPLLDAQKALTLTRARAAEWKIDPQKVGIIGFSAGGHLAATAATHFTPENRPDFAILIYPVITMSIGTHGGSKKNLLGATPSEELANFYSNEKQVTKDTPPTFLAHALDDKAVPIENSRLFHQACQAKGVPSKLLELPNGGHGLNGYKGPSWEAWQKQSLEWLRARKFIPESAK